MATEIARRQARDILLVEDDPTLRETVCLALQDEGHQVAAVADGEEALTLLRQYRYRLMLLDLVLPRLDGFAVLQKLRGAGSAPLRRAGSLGLAAADRGAGGAGGRRR